VDTTINVESRGDWTLVAIGGEVDVASAPRLRECLVDLIAGGATQVVLDLDEVDFLDSTGLGVIVGALKRVRGQGGDLRVVCSTTRIRKVFELTGLDRALVVSSSIDGAVGG
jgi:anti-sigma B factor antagonist